eukprot:Gb_27251 [translate_table: standard]
MDSEMVSMTSSTYAKNGSNGISAVTLHSDHFVSPQIDMKGFRLRKKSREKCWIIETVEENEEEETSRGLGMEASHGNEEYSVSILDAAKGRGLIMFNGGVCEEERGNEDDPVLEPSFSIDETAQLNSPKKLGGKSVSCKDYCSGRSANGYYGFGTVVAV